MHYVSLNRRASCRQINHKMKSTEISSNSLLPPPPSQLPLPPLPVPSTAAPSRLPGLRLLGGPLRLALRLLRLVIQQALVALAFGCDPDTHGGQHSLL